LMAEIERTEHGDTGKARAWTLRAVRALHDPAWTADGYVSATWRPVSPVTGRLDAFQWQTPVAALPSDKGDTIESSPFEEAMLAAPPPRRVEAAEAEIIEPPKEEPAEPAEVEPPATAEIEPTPPAETAAPAPQDNAPPAVAAEEPTPAPAPASSTPSPAESAPAGPAPLFRTRNDLPNAAPAPIPPVIPIVRAPDDPGIDEDGPRDEFAEQIGPPKAQASGWRGFLSRWGN